MIKFFIATVVVAWVCYNGSAKEFVEHVGIAMWAHVVASLIMSM